MVLLVLIFIVVPIAELYVIIQIGGLIGVLPTLALLLADALLGSLLLRHQGRGAWQRFNAAIAERRFPGREVADGAMIVIGGTLLLTPGFITDVFGLIFLIPPTRAIVRRLGRSYFTRRFLVIGVPDRGQGSTQSYDFDADAEEESPNGNSAPALPDDRRLQG